MRSIKRVIPSQKVNMGGIILDQPLPFKGMNQIDPFLLVHHWSQTYTGGDNQLQIGVGPHPHRGFSPVTLIFKGGIYHQDSAGNKSLVEAGGTQWMNSGHGVIHSERPAKKIAKEGGDFEIIQFWMNTPQAHKLDNYNYQPLSKAETPLITSNDKKIKTYIVAGSLDSKNGKINTFTESQILRFEITKGGKTTIKIPKGYNAFFYQLDGQLIINSTNTKAKDLVWLENDGNEEVSIEGLSNANLILLAGKPLNEPLATYGPFVMNTQQEIQQAVHDYQSGEMGTLIEKEEEE